MKKFMPILGFITIICIVIGTYIHVGGVFKGGFKWSDLPVIHLGASNGKGDTSFSESYKNVDKLVIDMSVGNVTLKNGDDLTVNYEGNEDLKPEVSYKDNKLEIKQKKNINIKGINLGKHKSELTITIPSTVELSKVDAELDMGDLKISGFSCKELDAELNMGDLEIKEVQATKIETDSDMGNIEIQDSAFDKLSADCNMGNITIGLTEDVNTFGIHANCDMGNVSIAGKDEGRSFSSNGNKTIKLDVDMGNIEIF